MPGASRLNGILDGRIVQNASALYAAHLVTFVLPLVTIPYLARVLGPEVWGIVLIVQAVGLYVMMVVEYYFDASATRHVARLQHDREALGEIAAGVLGARVLLALCCVAVLGLLQVIVPVLREAGWLLWLGCCWYIAQAFRPFWYFLGIERVSTFLVLEVSLKAAAVVGVFLFVKSPGDAWLVLLLQASAAVTVFIAGTMLMYRRVQFRYPRLRQSIATLKEGWSLFVFRASTSVYGMSNTFILGLVSSPVSVAYYAGADRVIRVMITFIYATVQALFPRASELASSDRFMAARMARVSTISIVIVATLGATLLYFMAPVLIRIALGPGYEDAAQVLRTLLLLLPILGVSLPISNHWIIPRGMESLLTRITILGGVVHVPLAILLGIHYAHVGIAWALVATEGLILVTLLVTLNLRGLGPFRFNEADGVFDVRTPKSEG